MKINISEIRIDGGTQSRVAIDQQVVEDYAEAIKVGIKFPEITLFFDGAVYWLVDGFHRYHAHRYAKKVGIDAITINGTQREAILYSVGANSDHGLRRSNADKRKAVVLLLADAEWGQWSDRQIADQCRVSHPFVASVRGSLTGNSSSEESGEPAESSGERKVTTKHGTVTTMATGGIAEANKGRGKPPTPPLEEDGRETEGEMCVRLLKEKQALEAQVDALSNDDQRAEMRKQLQLNARLETALGEQQDTNATLSDELKKYGDWFAELRKITGLEQRFQITKWARAMAATQKHVA